MIGGEDKIIMDKVVRKWFLEWRRLSFSLNVDDLRVVCMIES